MNFLGGNKKKYTVLNRIIALLSDRQAFFFNFVFVLLQKNSDMEGAAKKFFYVIKAILYYN